MSRKLFRDVEVFEPPETCVKRFVTSIVLTRTDDFVVTRKQAFSFHFYIVPYAFFFLRSACANLKLYKGSLKSPFITSLAFLHLVRISPGFACNFRMFAVMTLPPKKKFYVPSSF